MSFCDGFVPGARPKIFFDRFFLFLEIASLKSMLNYWTIPNLTISGTPNLSTRFLTFTGTALNFLYFGWKIRFQLHSSISRQQFSLNTYDDAFRGGDLHICERSCALDVQTELHFWGIDDLHLEVLEGLFPKNKYFKEIFWTNVVLIMKACCLMKYFTQTNILKKHSEKILTNIIKPC